LNFTWFDCWALFTHSTTIISVLYYDSLQICFFRNIFASYLIILCHHLQTTRFKCKRSAVYKIIVCNTKWSLGNKLIITLRSTLIYESEYSWIVSLTWTRRGTTTMGGVFGIKYCHILCITGCEPNMVPTYVLNFKRFSKVRL
jgi:hypothetical protein